MDKDKLIKALRTAGVSGPPFGMDAEFAMVDFT
jgi:hypothetical protein